MGLARVKVAPTQPVAYMGPKETAALIRRLLRTAFPATAFSVTIGRGSGVSSVHIRWTDGPTTQRVDAIVAGFEAGSFDGMTDSYNYDRDHYVQVNGVTYRPSTKYVFTARSHSPRSVARALRAVLSYWAMDPTTLAQMEAHAATIEATPTAHHVDKFWEAARYATIGGGGYDIGQCVSRALSDRTTCARAEP